MNVQYTFPYTRVRLVRCGNQYTIQEKTKEGTWAQAAKVRRWNLAESLLLSYYRIPSAEVQEARADLQRRLEDRYAAMLERRDRAEADFAAAKG